MADRADRGSLPNVALPAVELAPRLVGCRLAHVEGRLRRVGIIVEVEAYPGGADLASHTRLGRRTARNDAMWRCGGHAYVFFTYGMHWLFNVVSGQADSGEAVLVRALEPSEGLAAMREARGGAADRSLCSGPARLTEAMGIDRRFDGAWLLANGPLRLLPPAPGWSGRVAQGTRVGVAYAGEWADRPWRFWAAGSRFVSRGCPAGAPLWRGDALRR